MLSAQAVVFFNQKLLEHDPLTRNEKGGRLSSIISLLKSKYNWADVSLEADIAPMKRLRDIHDNAFLDDLHKQSYYGAEQLDSKTPLIKKSFEIARFGAGGVLDAVDLIMEGSTKHALCLTAMPGHHAGISNSGFGSLVNPIAAGAHYLKKKYSLKRIAIIDLDAEHGSGTQDIFYSRKDVLTVSIHEYPGVTGTGYYDETGGKGASGYNINLPVASGYGDREYKVCFNEIVEKILNQFEPQFILLSFGSNVLAKDPSSHLLLSENGLISTVKRVKQIASKFCEDKLICVLEGGTPGPLMARAVCNHFSLLLNNIDKSADNPKKEELISYADWYSYSKSLKSQLKRYWKL